MLKRMIFSAIMLSLTLSASLATAGILTPHRQGNCELPPPCEPIDCGVQPCEEAQCNPCDEAQCNPCDEVTCDPCGFGRGGLGNALQVGAWIEMGQYFNSHGTRYNGPMHANHLARTDFNMDQFYFYMQKELDAKKMQCRFDWGFQAELAFGVGGPGMQSYGDGSFDYNWGNNRHGYGMASPQLYGTFGYKNLQVKAGKFSTPIGWEATTAKDNFFFSHSYCYWLEPTSHTGFVADLELSDRLTLSAGWTAGHDVGFANRFNDNAVLAGLTLALTDKSTVYYWMNSGTNKWTDPKTTRCLVQSLCYEWTPTDRFTYVFQYNLHNDTADGEHAMGYGFNNHFLYQLTDTLGVGFRAEFVKDNGGYIDADAGNTDYLQFTWGLQWNPNDHWSIRPEVRYDTARGSAAPFGDGKKHQVTGGAGVVYIF